MGVTRWTTSLNAQMARIAGAGTGSEVVLVLGFELGLAALAAEIDGLAVVLQVRSAFHRGDRHAADRIDGGLR